MACEPLTERDAERHSQRWHDIADVAEWTLRSERVPRGSLRGILELEPLEHVVAGVPASRGDARERSRLVVGRERRAHDRAAIDADPAVDPVPAPARQRLARRRWS